ncbi:MAG: delta-60 repeat domain-containing protein [Actinomycetales bacterium]
MMRRFCGSLTSDRGPYTRLSRGTLLGGLVVSLTLGMGTFAAQAAEPTGGEVDQSFVVGAGLSGNTVAVSWAQGNGEALKTTADGSVLVGGFFTHYKDQAFQNLVRVRPDGSADPTFRFTYNPTPPEFPAPYTSGGVTYRFGPAGSTAVLAIEQVAADRFLVGGGFADWSFLKMIDGTGRQVEEFRCQAPRRSGTAWYLRTYCFNGSVHFIKSLGNNTYLIGGAFDTFSERRVSKLGRFKIINNVLTLDETFVAEFPVGNTGTEPTPKVPTYVNNVVVLANGDYMAGGDFTKYANRGTSGLVNITNTGAMLSTFDIKKGDKQGRVLALLGGYPNPSSVVVGGSFDRVLGSPVTNLAVLRPVNPRNGGRWTVDQTLMTTVPFNNAGVNFAVTSLFDTCDVPAYAAVTSLAKDANGFLYVGGIFDAVTSNDRLSPRSNVFRLDVDQNLDTTWAPGRVLDPQAAGYFVNGCARNDGTGPEVGALALGSTGGLIATGNFESVFNFNSDGNGAQIPSVNLVRLTTNTAASAGTASNTAVQAMKPELVGGKALTDKARFTISGTVTGNLAPGETVVARQLVIGSATFENGECRNTGTIDVTARGIAAATADGMVTVRPGRYMCASQSLTTSNGATRSGTAYYLVTAG